MNKILKFALKKSILNIKALIFLVVMLLLKVILAFVNIPQTGKNIDEKLYKKVISEMPGGYTQEKRDFVEERLEYFSDIKDEKTIEYNYYLGKYTDEEYREIKNDSLIAEKMIPVYSYIREKYNYYYEEYHDGRLFYDLDVQKYIASIGMEFTVIIFIAYIICNIFCNDYRCRTDVLVKTSYYGRKKLFECRILITMSVAVVLSIVSLLLDYLIKSRLFDINYYNYSIKSIMEMSGFTLDISVGNAILLINITKFIYMIIFSFILIGISRVLKNTYYVFLAGAGLVLFTYILSEFVPKAARFFLPGAGLTGIKLFI